MKLLSSFLLLFFLAINTSAQIKWHNLINTKDKAFYISQLTQKDDSNLFLGKVVIDNKESINVFQTNCSNSTEMLLVGYMDTDKIYIYKEPVVVKILDRTPIKLAFLFICGEQT